MNESFGTRLRRERERREIPLAAIAANTKIALGLLEELEDDAVTRWPSGIFRRAYIRSYAQAIGVNPDTVAREFLELYPDPLDVEAGLETPPPPQSRSGSAATWILRRLKTAIGTDEPPASPARIEPPPDANIHPAAPPVTAVVPAATVYTQRTEDFSAAAALCTELARVSDPDDVPPLLERFARLLDAVGVVVWLSDDTGERLTPALACGYPDALVARISNMHRTAQNATAAAFRSAQPEIVTATEAGNGAIAIPMVTPSGCAGVLAAEIKDGGEQSEWVSAIGRIFAAQLGMLIAAPSAEARRAHA